jgi:hypothetical protein
MIRWDFLPPPEIHNLDENQNQANGFGGAGVRLGNVVESASRRWRDIQTGK